MRLARDVGPDDLRVLRAYLKTRPEGRRYRQWEYFAYLAFAAFVGFGILAIPLARWTASNPAWFVVSPLIGLILWHPLWHILDRIAERRFIRLNKAELGHQEFWVDENGFGNSTPAGSTFHNWPTVVAVETAPNLGLVAAGVHLYSLPSGANSNEFHAFMAEVTARWRNGNGKRDAGEQGVEADKAPGD
jgi:O-antigen ligase